MLNLTWLYSDKCKIKSLKENVSVAFKTFSALLEKLLLSEKVSGKKGKKCNFENVHTSSKVWIRILVFIYPQCYIRPTLASYFQR